MKKQLGGVAVAVAGVIGFASPAAAGPIVVAPGYDGLITTTESMSFDFSGCDGTVDFVKDQEVNGVDIFTYLGTSPTGSGTWTFSSPDPGNFKIIVNCFVNGTL
jgi:hypothetical protein